MEKSKLSNKVMFLDRFDDQRSVWYKVACNCGVCDEDATIELEYDEKLKMIFMTFYKDMVVSEPWKHDTVLDRLERYWNRFRNSMRLLFTGHLEMESDLILRDKEHIIAFIEALEEGLNLCEGWAAENGDDDPGEEGVK